MSKLPHDFWQAVPLTPIPGLQQLGEWVIKQNEKRLPKWKFRFAPDLAAQIQPKLTRAYALLFEGRAIMVDTVSVKMFTEPKTLRGSRHWTLSFVLRCRQGETTWEFKPTSAGWGRDCYSLDELIRLRQRTFDVLTPERFAVLTPDLMLSPNCLCCGKGLTDPVSMSRWIGPECWGSASTNIPRMFKADAPTENLFAADEADPPVAEQLISSNALRQRRYRERNRALREPGVTALQDASEAAASTAADADAADEAAPS